MYNKYHSTKVLYDNIKFDSKKECKRYQELKLMEQLGEIKDLELQYPIVLQKKFKDKFSNKTIREIKYLADFKYVKDNIIILEDTKGMKTDVYNIKHKMLLLKLQEMENIEFYEL